MLTGLAGGTRGGATDINDAGTIVGWAQDATDDRAVQWSQNTVIDLGVPRKADYAGTVVEDVFAVAYGIGSTGVVVGEFRVEGTKQGRSFEIDSAFRWTQSTGLVRLPGLNGEGAIASAVNGAGTAVGTSAGRAVMWTPGGTIIDLNPAGATGSSAYDINEAGWIVGSASGAWGTHAYLWSPTGNPTDITPLSQPFRFSGEGLNEQGLVVGHSRPTDPNLSSNLQAFRRTSQPLLSTLVMPLCTGTAQRAFEVSDLERIVGECTAPGTFRGWTLRNGAHQLLPQLPGGARSTARAVNTCGTIVGDADVSSGASRPVRWTKSACDT